jgi:hypothetical protein
MLLFAAALAVSLLVVLAPLASAAPTSVPAAGTVQADGPVYAILPLGNRIYIGGDFTHINGQSRTRLAAIDATTGQLTNWAPSANGWVGALAASPDGTRIYAGGRFTAITDPATQTTSNRWRLAALNASTGTLDSTWKPVANGGVYALAVTSNRVFIGGNFTTLSGLNRTHLAAVDPTTGGVDPSWTPTANLAVRALGLSGDRTRVYAGGDFSSVSGQSRPYLAALDRTSGALQAWRPPSPNGPVIALTAAGTRVYTAEGGPGGAVAAYEGSTASRAWRQLSDGDAQAITVLDTKVYVGGHFEVLAGQSRIAFGALDLGTGALDQQWAPYAMPAGTSVWSLSSDASRSRIYAGGEFTGVSGQTRLRFAQFS